jgi:trigger factor
MHKGTTVTYPPQVLKDELSDMLQDLDARLRSQGMNLAEYLKAEKKTEQELRTELEPRARRQLERALVLYEIVEAERLQVEEPEIAEATDRLSAGAQAGTVESLRKALEQPQNRRRIAFNLLTEKALKQVATIARGEAGPVPPASEPTDEPSGESDVQATP